MVLCCVWRWGALRDTIVTWRFYSTKSQVGFSMTSSGSYADLSQTQSNCQPGKDHASTLNGVATEKSGCECNPA